MKMQYLLNQLEENKSCERFYDTNPEDSEYLHKTLEGLNHSLDILDEEEEKVLFKLKIKNKKKILFLKLKKIKDRKYELEEWRRYKFPTMEEKAKVIEEEMRIKREVLEIEERKRKELWWDNLIAEAKQLNITTEKLLLDKSIERAREYVSYANETCDYVQRIFNTTIATGRALGKI